MNKYSFYLILFVFGTACNSKSKSVQGLEEFPKNAIKKVTDSIMNERYDYESTDGGKKSIYVEQNGWIISMNSMTEGGSFYDMYPPSPQFYRIQKEFYPNGNIQSEKKYLGNGVIIDTSRYYNEAGYLVEEVNENKKFGRVRPEHILNFLEKEKWINQKTGEGRPVFTLKDNQLYNSIDCIFKLIFEPVGKSLNIKNNKVPVWVVLIPACDQTKWVETKYLIDGESGQLLKKDIKKIFPIY